LEKKKKVEKHETFFWAGKNMKLERKKIGRKPFHLAAAASPNRPPVTEPTTGRGGNPGEEG